MELKRRDQFTPPVAMVVEMSEHAGRGTEEITIEDLPRAVLRLLQQLSPVVTIGEEDYIEAAKPGMFYNAGTCALFCDDGEPGGSYNPLIIVPVKYTRRDIEYERGRGPFVAVHLPKSEMTIGETIVDDEKGGKHRITDNNTELVDTSIIYALVINPENNETQEVVLSLSSTAKQFAKKLNAQIKGFRDMGADGVKYQPAYFSRAFTIYSELKNGDKGNYYVWKFKNIQKLEPDKFPSHNVVAQAALTYLTLIESDVVNVDHENQ